MSNIKKGEDFEFLIREKLITAGMECNKTQASCRGPNDELVILGDGNIDLFGNYKEINFIIQCKYKNANKYKVGPSEVREFLLTLMKQQANTLGVYVTNSSYTARCQNELNNFPNLKVILCTDNNIVYEIQKMKDIIVNENENHFFSSINNLNIDEIELDNCDSNIFGMKFNGGSVRIKKISFDDIRYQPY